MTSPGRWATDLPPGVRGPSLESRRHGIRSKPEDGAHHGLDPGRGHRLRGDVGAVQGGVDRPGLGEPGASRRSDHAPHLGHLPHAVPAGAAERAPADPGRGPGRVAHPARGIRRVRGGRGHRIRARGPLRPFQDLGAGVHALRGRLADGADPGHSPDGGRVGWPACRAAVAHRLDHRRLSHVLPGGDQHPARSPLPSGHGNGVDAQPCQHPERDFVEAPGPGGDAIHLHRPQGVGGGQRHRGHRRRASRRLPGWSGPGPAPILATVHRGAGEAVCRGADRGGGRDGVRRSGHARRASMGGRRPTS